MQVYEVLTIDHTKVRFEEHKKQQHVEQIAYLKFRVCEMVCIIQIDSHVFIDR